MPDWLDFDSDADFSETDDDAPFEDETDDWMTRLGGDSEPEKSPLPQATADPDSEREAASRMDFNNNGIPDWLEDMETERTTPSLGTAQESSDSDFPSWLSVEEEAESPKPIDETSDLPDWLSGSDAQEDDAPLGDLSSAAPESPFTSEEGDLPDWLTSDRGDETDIPSGTGDVLPGWLSEGGDEETPSHEETPGYIGQETIPIEDYLQSDEASPALGAEEADLPDWLSAGAEEAESISPSEESDLPDWLSGLGADDVPSAEGEPPVLSAEDSDPPDWLADLRAQEEAQTEDLPRPQKPFDMDTGTLYGMLDDDGADVVSAAAVESEVPDLDPPTGEIDLQPESLTRL